jgi:hypothetical protein
MVKLPKGQKIESNKQRALWHKVTKNTTKMNCKSAAMTLYVVESKIRLIHVIYEICGLKNDALKYKKT